MIQIQKDSPIPEASPGSFMCQVFKLSYTGARFKVSSERLIRNFSWPDRESNLDEVTSLAYNRFSYTGWQVVF
jgi:hypothetical protein